MTDTGNLVATLAELRVLPLIVIDSPDDALPLARALIDGGLPCAEVTFRTPCATEAMRIIAESTPELLLGAGTVLTPRQAADAQAAGAQFIVTPGFNPSVVDFCQERGVPVFPGICTPTELDAALGRGIDVLKFFPAEPMGGVSFLKAIAAPYSAVRFIPTGGINRNNMPGYLSLDCVVACGGSWLAPRDWIRSRRFEEIRAETERTLRAARAHARGAQ